MVRSTPPESAGLVSLVVTATDRHAQFLGECLDTLRGQTHRLLEVIVVPYGDGGAVRDLAARHAAADGRIVVAPDEESSLGSARNAGAARARGAFLGFVHGADTLPPQGIALLVRSLRETGSDFALGKQTFRSPTSRPGTVTQRRVHAERKRQVTVAQFPEALTDTHAENRLFRTDFWRSHGLGFADSSGSALRVTMTRAYLAARRFDVLTGVTYHAMDRGHGVAFDHVHPVVGELVEWLDAQHQTRRALGSESPELLQAWTYGLLDSDVVPFLDDAERMTTPHWSRVSAATRAFVESADGGTWSRVRPESRVKAWLASHGRREELEEFVASRWFEQGGYPTLVREGQVVAAFPALGEAVGVVPEHCLVHTEEQTPLVSSLRGLRWEGQHALVLDVFAYVDLVDQSGVPPRLTARLTDRSSGRSHAIAVEPRVDPEVNVFAGRRHQNLDRGAFTLRVDVRPLLAGPSGGPSGGTGGDTAANAEWHLVLCLETRGIVRTGSLEQRDPQAFAGPLQAQVIEGRHLRPLLADAGLRLAVAAAEVVCTHAAVSGRTVTLRIVSGAPTPVARVEASAAGEVVTATGRPPEGGEPEGSEPEGSEVVHVLELPPAGAPGAVRDQRRWTVSAVTDDGRRLPIPWPADLASSWLESPDAPVALHRTASAAIEVRDTTFSPMVDDATLREGELELSGHWPGTVPDRWRLMLTRGDHFAPAQVTPVEGGRFQATILLTDDRWGLGARPLPSGDYRLVLERLDRAGNVVETSEDVLAGEVLTQRLPVEASDSRHRLSVLPAPADRMRVRLSAPLPTDQRGPYAQHRLQQRARTDTRIDGSAVYFQCFGGRAATDSQLAIHHALRRVRPDLTLHWGVADCSVVLPEGASPTLMHSDQWYDVRSTARHLVVNDDFGHRFPKNPGQKLLHTFHGYPSKAMGLRQWEAKNFTPRRLEMELARTSRDWDLILTPIPEMDRYYREEYRYDGAILSVGYPRDDLLLSAEADEVRRDTRRRLGIADEQTVVLYAPTWRDYLATDYRTVPLAQHLDLAAASAALGDDHVLLARGHRFHARSSPGGAAAVRDVTEYPEVNHLILAADVAVLDYSSLRFDFALTGKPMLFLVPDLDDYSGGARGFLYDYRSTAPGPLLDTADQVVAALRRLGDVEKEYAGEIHRFNERYQYLQDAHTAERVVAAFFDPRS